MTRRSGWLISVVALLCVCAPFAAIAHAGHGDAALRAAARSVPGLLPASARDASGTAASAVDAPGSDVSSPAAAGNAASASYVPKAATPSRCPDDDGAPCGC